MINKKSINCQKQHKNNENWYQQVACKRASQQKQQSKAERVKKHQNCLLIDELAIWSTVCNQKKIDRYKQTNIQKQIKLLEKKIIIAKLNLKKIYKTATFYNSKQTRIAN